jgi:chlorobactene glucosyltransferase
MNVIYPNNEFLLLIADLSVLVITMAIGSTWSYFMGYMAKSFSQAPKLQQSTQSYQGVSPRISVIVPARNEEDYIGRCLDSLIRQDYPNFEIILIDDSSHDRTWRIMQDYAARHREIITPLRAGPVPPGWVGKNWACYRGYLLSKGDLLLFTDADTQHGSSSMRLAHEYLAQQNVDAITLIPRLLCRDIWTRITLPVLSIFLHTRFSPLRVNNPATKVGYFFGSFYLIKRAAYESVGTHKLVRQELVEDGALGAELKRRRFQIRMVRGEQYVTAIWARDLAGLWHGLRRLLIPLHARAGFASALMTVAVILLLLWPLVTLPISVGSLVLSSEFDPKNITQSNLRLASLVIVLASALGVLLIFLCSAVQSKLGIFQSPLYALCCPLAAVILCSCFLSSLNDARKGGLVTWRGRQYNMHERNGDS